MPVVALAPDAGNPPQGSVVLGTAPIGFTGRITRVRAPAETGGLSEAELERRLIELGFVEGARVEVLHQGPFGRDPIAVRVADTTIALRRREAMAILVDAEGAE